MLITVCRPRGAWILTRDARRGIRSCCFRVGEGRMEVSPPLCAEGFSFLVGRRVCWCGISATGGAVTDSQLFAFAAGKTSLPLAPENAKGATCLVPVGGKLGSAACGGDAGQLFSIGWGVGLGVGQSGRGTWRWCGWDYHGSLGLEDWGGFLLEAVDVRYRS